MRRRVETHTPGQVSKLTTGSERSGEGQAEIQIEGTDLLYGVANVLSTPKGETVHLKEGDGVDGIVAADEVEPGQPK
jgi:hypothetical protein